MITDRTRGAVKDTWALIKDQGICYVVVGFAFRLDKLHDRLERMEQDVETIKNLLKANQSNMYEVAESMVSEKLRSPDGLSLINFENQDVYRVNIHIERLERKLEELKSSLNNRGLR